MNNDVVIILDCGATNVRAIAVDAQGIVVAKATTPNASQPATENDQWHVWSLDDILQRFADCCQRIMPKLGGAKIHAISVTTFGVDGALVDANGELLYPVISWKCPRTAAIMEKIDRYITPDELQTISGIGQFSFNTLYKLIWLKENRPELLEKAHAWLFISSLINQRLTGEFTTDRTMAGTSQLLDVRQETFSDTILQRTGLPIGLFPRIVAAGEHIGHLLPHMAERLGIPAGTPVIATGHDTQFALFGSGAGLDQPVLSSGTWEILMVRTPQVNTSLLPRFIGSTCELDSCEGLFNPGLQWLASGVLEKVRQLYWPNGKLPDVYSQMIAEAANISPGSEGLRMNCQLLDNRSPAGWSGMRLHTERGHFYRSALEGLSWQLQQNLALLENIGGFTSKELLLVGGGSRNTLWNQIKADVLNLPIKVLHDAETTVLGAAMFAWSGVGYYDSPEQARQQVNYRYQSYYPSEQSAEYRELTTSHNPILEGV
ncbi:L-fuculokinase [Hafnia paralvei]|uniref:L-fuculokinase n=1 Tax=Hafnia paralvei TaxID=546367 RepID=UPI0010347198|nr:L-fuculokinase [Hafnia paralvei]TBM20387.1 L-fuculokinase [Hafnia paralvei]TBM25438.1 L-fuculokinase [Hafnia paralvei]